jgi:polyhydroxyalkanoate synthesis regulator phasin
MTTTTVEETQVVDEGTKVKVEKALEIARDKANKTVQQFRQLPAVTLAKKITRNTILAGLGAFVIVREQFNKVADRCIDRGSEVEQDTKQYARKVVDEILTTARLKKAEVKMAVETSDKSTDLTAPVASEESPVTVAAEVKEQAKNAEEK